MTQQGKAPERERRDWSIILIILLLGFLCMIVVGEWAIRFSPIWKLNTNMGSNINPNSDFLTNRPVSLLEPLDPSILTQPVWINVFLTPGAIFQTNTPAPTVPPVNTPLGTNTTAPTAINSPTPIPSVASPTRTPPFFPPPTSTPITPSTISVDLQVTKSDGGATYTAGSTVTYTVAVTNNGPNNVTGAIISDNIPAQVTSWDWVCAAIVNAGGCDAVTGSTANFTDTVNIQSGGSITYTVSADINAGATGNLVNTASVSVPSGYTDTNNGNNSATDTDTLFVPSVADLSITKTDNATHYTANATKTYIIVASNAGPSNVTGATVTDNFSGNIASATWTCAGTGGGTCAANGSGNINDNTVNLPIGASVTYTVTATVVGGPSGNLVNTASISPPGGITDPNNGNDSATDTDTLITTVAPPPEIGTTPDNTTYNLGTGGTLTLSININVNGHVGYDLVYYEFVNGSGIFMDNVIIEVSDGSNWYTILNWGNGLQDANTNVAIPLPTPPNPSTCAGEPDNCVIDASLLRAGTGIEIDLDSVVPTGSYLYIRFTAPAGDSGNDGLEIDAIEILP